MLKLNNISKHYGAVEVLKNISLEFSPGTVTAIVGDNGAGKSTLLKVVTGVVKPDRGAITLGQRDISSLNPGARRNCGIEMVYQDLALAPEHDAVTNLFIGREIATYFGLLQRKEMRRRALAVLKELEIQIPSVDRAVGNYSGGQQQAVAIARAILFCPEVILLDEPTAALAAREVDRVLSLIRRERDKGRIIVLVSHRLNDVFAVADRIVVLKHGSVGSDETAASLSIRDVVEKIVS
jgi:ABC-type sugar transport system ATPase subunit